MRNRIGLATLALLAIATTAAQAPAAERYTERSDQTVEIRGVRVIKVDNPRGDVEVTPSADGRLHLTAIKICRGHDRAEAQRFAREITVTAGAQGNRYVIRVNYPRRVDFQINLWDFLSGRGESGDYGPRHDLRLQIQAPAGLSFDLGSVSGDLSARGLAGSQRLHTTSGDCLAEAAGGVLQLDTVSGDAEVRGAGRSTVRTTSGDIKAAIAGALDARTVSGDIEVRSASDSLTLGTTSGDIEVQDAPRGITATTSSGSLAVGAARGRVVLRSSSGSVQVGLRAPLAAARVESSSGDVEMDFGAGVEASLELSTGSGDIECEVPVLLRGHDRHHLNAQLGRGGAAVQANTMSGDLHVTSGGR